ncbi:MAG: helix-turn-helix domain-containing protein [Bacteroidales bacterium]|nr:helix-turn-helix domain-containing protein [Bacteroidales bacterium]
MEQLKQTFCLYDMVCDNPKGNGLEITRLPDFFSLKPELETRRIHVHPFYEIIWFKKGEGLHTVDFTQYPVTDNTVFFIAPGQVHSFDSHRNVEGYVMKICSNILNEDSYRDGVLLKYNLFNAHDGMPFKQINEQYAHSIEGIFDSIEKEVEDIDAIGHKEYLQALVKMLLIQIERCQVEQNNPVFSTTRTAHRMFLAFRREIEHNYHKLHTVKEYASLLHISTRTLTNYVAECSSFSPLEMINNRIILEAKRMLRYSDMMIKEIAFRLGFEDPSYFVKFFKRLVKCSPAEYRTPE